MRFVDAIVPGGLHAGLSHAFVVNMYNSVTIYVYNVYCAR